MKFKLDHEFPCTPEEYWQVLGDDAIDREIATSSDGTYKLISETSDNGTYRKTSLVVMNRDLPSAMVKVLKTNQIGYELTITRPLSSVSATWAIKPLVLPDRVDGGGTTSFRATSTGCIRTIEGELSVKVPLIGKMMEERLVNDVSASYDRGADIIRRHIREKLGK